MLVRSKKERLADNTHLSLFKTKLNKAQITSNTTILSKISTTMLRIRSTKDLILTLI